MHLIRKDSCLSADMEGTGVRIRPFSVKGFIRTAACTAAAILLLIPATGQAARSSAGQNKPVVTMGDRPGMIPARDTKAGGRKKENKKEASGTEKAGSRTQPAITKGKTAANAGTQGAAAGRGTSSANKNSVYILPKGYKDITIKGKATATKKQAAQLIAANNKNMGIGCSIGEIVDLYWEEAEREGIRPDMALSQALLETGYFNFGGSVEPWQHNFCGLGTIGNGVQGAAFRTPGEGVRAHIQHLMAYSSHDLPKTELIDPRYDKAHNLRLEKGLITKWSGLNWTWAMGGEYAEKIVNTHQLMLRCEDREPDGMWEDHKKQQKELEKVYDKKMKEQEEAKKKYQNPERTKIKQGISPNSKDSSPALRGKEKPGRK